MAVIRWQHFSTLLKQHTSLTVTLPEPTAVGQRYPLLYLLHGGTENATTWLREANLEAISERFQIATLSLDGQSSAYVDMRHGGKYFSYLTEELPTLVPTRLPVSNRPEETMIAGFSMGGQGALRAAFRHPERYAACFALSGARDMIPLFEKWASMENGPDLQGVTDALGPIDQLRGGDNDIVALAEQAARASKPLPHFYLACGNDDYAVALSDAYHEHLLTIGLPHEYYKAQGIHSYEFAERALIWGLERFSLQRSQTV